VIGHTAAFLRDPLAALERWGACEPPVVRASVAGRSAVVLTRAGAAEQVLVGDSGDYRKAAAVSERLGRLQGGSLVLLEGEAWRERRRTLRTAVTGGSVGGAATLATEYARERVAAWTDGTTVAVDEAASDLSLSILARALFGLDLRGGDTPIHDAADDVMRRLSLRSPSAYLPDWVPTPTNRRYRRAVATLHERLDATVADRVDGDQADPTADANRADLLSTMIAAGLPAETVRDELIAFLFAGFDSLATALSCTLASVAAHPPVQRRLAAELTETLGDAPPTGEDLESLPYLDAVVRESLRLYPPQFLLLREPTERVTLAGYRVERGSTVVVPPWSLHRSERYWDAPSVFDPDRWLADDGSSRDAGDRPNGAYLPYGIGPRHCLGKRMADRILRLVVAVICRDWRVESERAVAVTAGPTLQPSDGFDLTAHRRE